MATLYDRKLTRQPTSNLHLKFISDHITMNVRSKIIPIRTFVSVIARDRDNFCLNGMVPRDEWNIAVDMVWIMVWLTSQTIRQLAGSISDRHISRLCGWNVVYDRWMDGCYLEHGLWWNDSCFGLLDICGVGIHFCLDDYLIDDHPDSDFCKCHNFSWGSVIFMCYGSLWLVWSSRASRLRPVRIAFWPLRDLLVCFDWVCLPLLCFFLLPADWIACSIHWPPRFIDDLSAMSGIRRVLPDFLPRRFRLPPVLKSGNAP
jgi:hypothetical protein